MTTLTTADLREVEIIPYEIVDYERDFVERGEEIYVNGEILRVNDFGSQGIIFTAMSLKPGKMWNWGEVVPCVKRQAVRLKALRS